MAQNVNAGRRSADFTARSVQEAIERASTDLKVPVAELDYTVLRDNTHTILGLVRTGEATIRVWLQETGASAPAASRPAVLAAQSTAEADAEATQDWDDFGEDAEQDAGEDAEEEPADRDADARDGHLEGDGAGEEDGGEDSADTQGYSEAEDTYLPAAPSGRKSEHQDLARVTSDVVARLIDGMGLYAAVEVVERGGQVDPETQEVAPLQVNIIGDDLGVLIGRRGETLRDLQFLTRLIVSRQIGKWPNVVVDVEGYKSRRADALEALARRMADRVRTTRQPVTLEPMPAYERRIVHLTLRNDKDVYTESIGEGEARKVQILLKGE